MCAVHSPMPRTAVSRAMTSSSDSRRKPSRVEHDGAVEGLGGQVPQRRRLVGRQAGRPKGLVREPQEGLRLDVAVESRHQPAVDGGGRRPRQLLVGDGPDQGGEMAFLGRPDSRMGPAAATSVAMTGTRSASSAAAGLKRDPGLNGVQALGGIRAARCAANPATSGRPTVVTNRASGSTLPV